MSGGSSQNGSDPGPNLDAPSTPASLAAEASGSSRSNGAGSAGASIVSPTPDLAETGTSARDGGGGGGGGSDAKTALVDARWTAYVGEETAPQARPHLSHFEFLASH